MGANEAANVASVEGVRRDDDEETVVVVVLVADNDPLLLAVEVGL